MDVREIIRCITLGKERKKEKMKISKWKKKEHRKGKGERKNG